MIVSRKNMHKSVVELEIKVPAEDVENAYKLVFKRLQSSMKINGFRKGKAPLNIIEVRYLEHATKDVAESLVRSEFIKAVRGSDIRPISEPEYDFDKISRDEPFLFKAKFDVFPTIELGKYKQIPVEEDVYNINNSDVKNEIDTVLEKHAEFIKKDDNAVIEDGDHVSIGLKRIDNLEIDEIESIEFRNYNSVIEKNGDKYTFDPYLLGMKVNEDKEIEISYPEDYKFKELADQKIKYLVMINEISNKKIPDINDEFAKKLNFESVEDLTDNIKQIMLSMAEERIKSRRNGRMLAKVAEGSNFDLPETMIINESVRIFQDAQKQLGSDTNDLDQFAAMLGLDPEEYRNRLRTQAEQGVKSSIILAEVGKKEELEVDESEYDEFIKKAADKSNRKVEEFEAALLKSRSKEDVINEILIDKTIDFIYSNAKVKKLKPLSFKELIEEKVT